MARPQTEKEKSRKFRIELNVLDLVLAFVVALFLILYTYHQAVVQPLREKLAVSRIYVVDLDGLVEEFRRRAIEKALSGENVRPEEVAESVRKYLDTVLSGLPPEAVVLDDRCVVRGGLRIPLIAPPAGSTKIPLPEEKAAKSTPSK